MVLDDSIDLEIVARLREWIANLKGISAEIGIDTHLINQGVLDSLEMVNFLLYIEELRGKEIPESLIQPQFFTCLRIIHDTFFRSPSKQTETSKGAGYVSSHGNRL
jgi:acyl carrier protein